MRLYAVSSGSYDEYGIDAIFLTRQDAEAYILNQFRDDFLCYETPRIEEWETGVAVSDRKPYIVSLKRNGDLISIKETTVLAIEDINPIEREYPDNGSDRPTSFSFIVAARDEAHAIKIAGEYRALAIAIEYP